MSKTVAIMQPYIFPYIGYFQLIDAVDTFVFYDDVNFIKGGWINRNRLLIDGAEKLITFPCIGASPNKLIKEVKVDTTNREYAKIMKSIQYSYSKAPHFEEVFTLIKTLLSAEYKSVADLASQSIVSVLKYLDIKKKIIYSSNEFSETRGMHKAERLIKLSRCLDADTYVNAIGGKALYRKEEFAACNLELKFLKPNLKPYSQFSNTCILGLSIIDVLMFNTKEEVLDLIKGYQLI
jgi:hypothetical protein